MGTPTSNSQKPSDNYQGNNQTPNSNNQTAGQQNSSPAEQTTTADQQLGDGVVMQSGPALVGKEQDTRNNNQGINPKFQNNGQDTNNSDPVTGFRNTENGLPNLPVEQNQIEGQQISMPAEQPTKVDQLTSTDNSSQQQITAENSQPTEPEVVEKVVYRDRRRGFNPFRFIKRLGCFLLLAILISIITLIVTIIFRPSLTWNPLKEFLNNGYSPNEIQEYTYDQTRDYINSTVVENQEVELRLNETQLTTIFRNGVTGTGSTIDIEENSFKVLTDITTNEEIPLWVQIELFENDEGNLAIKKVGFERFGMPQAFNNFLASAAFRAINLTQGDFTDTQTVEAFISSLLTNSLDREVVVIDVSFVKNEVVIRYSVK